jgi:hypothetical protein
MKSGLRETDIENETGKRQPTARWQTGTVDTSIVTDSPRKCESVTGFAAGLSRESTRLPKRRHAPGTGQRRQSVSGRASWIGANLESSIILSNDPAAYTVTTSLSRT